MMVTLLIHPNEYVFFLLPLFVFLYFIFFFLFFLFICTRTVPFSFFPFALASYCQYHIVYFHMRNDRFQEKNNQKNFMNKEFYVDAFAVIVVVVVDYSSNEKRQNMFHSLNVLRHFHTSYKRITISQKLHGMLLLKIRMSLLFLCVISFG